MFIFLKYKEPLGVISRKFAYKFVKSKYSEKFQINRNLQTILFKMIHNIFILRHLFSTERWGEGRPEPPRSLILLKCVFSGERTITSPNFMVLGFQMEKLQRGGGGGGGQGISSTSCTRF